MNKSFITRLELNSPLKGKPILFYLIIFGIPYYALLTYHIFYFRIGSIDVTGKEIFFMYMGASWSWIGPYCIWRYETIILESFWKKAICLFEEDNAIGGLKEKFQFGLFQRYWVFMLFWIVCVLAAFYSVQPYMVKFGVNGLLDKAFYIWAILIAFLAMMNGYGFAGVLKSMYIITDISKSNFVLNQYHYDGRGGLSCLGELTLSTIFVFSSGSLFVPILVAISNYQGVVSSCFVIILIMFFSITVLIGFLYPLLVVHRRSFQMKFNKYHEMMKHTKGFLQPEYFFSNNKLLSHMTAMNYRNFYVDLKEMSTYPINTKILAEIIFYAFLPFLMILAQKVLMKI